MKPKLLATSVFLLLFSLQNLPTNDGADILFFWGMSGISHRITIWPLVEKLAERGHKITFFSPYKSKSPITNPNITDLTMDNLVAKLGMDYDPVEFRLKGGVKAAQALWSTYWSAGINLCSAITSDKGIMEWANTASYDLVVVNGLFNDCGFGFAWKFKAPTVVYGTSSLFPWWGETYGLAEENYPEFRYHLPVNMTFSQQVWNSLTPLYWRIFRTWWYLPMLDSIVRPALGIHDMPSLEEMDQQTSLILLNTHFSEEFPRSFPPWVVSVGGMHCSGKTKPLPNELQQFIDKWDNGFIYFSFGTYMRLPLLPQSYQDAIFAAIKKFPNIGFVMKWNGGPQPKSPPDNVYTSEWLAQQDILAHPKIRAFIAHGGLLGTQEAVFNAVPMIVFPIFAEQDYNANRIHAAERGILMEISELSADKLENAIREVLTNKKYKENMKITSKIFRDRPEAPADTAAWWIEYVLRHKDTSFLKPAGLGKTWFERRMLHVWGFVAVVLIISLLISLRLLRLIVNVAFGGKKDKKLKKR